MKNAKQLNSMGINNFKVFNFLLQDCPTKGTEAKNPGIQYKILGFGCI